ncbi:MAG: formylglycine-generating enzyme family protein [Alcaligenaceae bacterium]|nr:formylglycine-generating enzyme family protein [Alcaligenaceae bacterium]
MRLFATRFSLARLALWGGFIALAVPGLHVAAENVPDHLAVIAPGEVEYYTTDGGLVDGQPALPHRVRASFDKPILVMKRQVSQAEYAQCVSESGCRPLHKTIRNNVAPDMPVVGVSWEDAQDYARWYSGHTGRHYRLPTYAEWVLLAGELFSEDERLDIYDSSNPAQRWLAEYALEAQRKSASDPNPKPFGTFSTTKAGVQDIGGNVWDWTDTCYVVNYHDSQGNELMPSIENCGIRVVGGSHPSLITNFMRDPKAGACSVGIPPANLGIRLVAEE